MTDSPCNIPQSLQDLLPKWAHFCLYVEKFITEELGIDLSDKRILVGLSGGVDSTALLCVLKYLSQRAGFQVMATHLNHGLRAEAVQDAQWVKSLCDTLGVECHAVSQDIGRLAQEQAIGIEEAGRNARYALYADVRMENGADYVALGHQLDDLSEDVLMRLIRGTGWPGLSGMAGYDPDRALLRPLLMIPKSTLIAFVTHLGIVWREDHTNADLNLTRNRVRNEILPLIQRENPNFWQSVTRLWKIGRIESDYWDIATADTTECLENARLNELHKACRLRLYKACLDRCGPGQVLAETLFKLDEAWQDKRVGTVFQFPGEKSASITASGVLFKATH
jgi:tRNA(Ile)-lysidine synthase